MPGYNRRDSYNQLGKSVSYNRLHPDRVHFNHGNKYNLLARYNTLGQAVSTAVTVTPPPAGVLPVARIPSALARPVTVRTLQVATPVTAMAARADVGVILVTPAPGQGAFTVHHPTVTPGPAVVMPASVAAQFASTPAVTVGAARVVPMAATLLPVAVQPAWAGETRPLAGQPGQLTVQVAANKRVDSITANLVGADYTGTLWVADLQLQEGRIPTLWVPNPREMLKRERDQAGNILPNRHFNAVVRGSKIVSVPNRAPVSQDTTFSLRVTGGMDYSCWPTVAAPTVTFAHEYGNKLFILGEALAAGDRLDFRATSRTVAVNGVPTANYTGSFHTCPGGFGRFRVTMPAGLLLCEPDQWLLGPGGERI